MIPDPAGRYFEFFGTDGPASYSIVKYTSTADGYTWQQVGVFQGESSYIHNKVVIFTINIRMLGMSKQCRPRSDAAERGV